MNKKILLTLIPENSQELISNLHAISNLSHPNFEMELKVVVNLKALTDAEKTLLENNSTAIIALQDNFELGKIHKIIFEYSRKMQYDFIILANLMQYEYLKSNLHELLDPLHPDLAYLTGGETVHSQFGIVNFIQQKVFQKQLNLFPKICIYNTHFLSKIPHLYNSDSASFINEIAIQIVLSDLEFKEVKSNLKTKIPTAVKLQTLQVFFRAYLHSLGIFYQNKFDIIKDNLQYSLKLNYASSHTFAIDAVPANSHVIDIGAGPFGVGHELKKKGCHVVTVDQFDIPERYKLDQHIITNLDKEFSISIQEYDCILFLDIIEHLVNPEEFMFNLSKQFSYQKQKVVFTTGNISFFPVRMVLLLGYFNYGKSGILDKTHTRLFTFSSFEKLISDAGLIIKEVKGIPAPYPKALGNNFLSKTLLALNLLFIKLSKGLFSYQIYIEAETNPSVYYIVNEALKEK
jgi:2-polyprenyl-3-methyl-5-hydroxy-6-metoxy-1,4-benzoquinol methylase